jgi:hypothetical protein
MYTTYKKVTKHHSNVQPSTNITYLNGKNTQHIFNMDIASCGIVVYSCHVIYIKTNQVPPKAWKGQ